MKLYNTSKSLFEQTYDSINFIMTHHITLLLIYLFITL